MSIALSKHKFSSCGFPNVFENDNIYQISRTTKLESCIQYHFYGVRNSNVIEVRIHLIFACNFSNAINLAFYTSIWYFAYYDITENHFILQSMPLLRAQKVMKAEINWIRTLLT